MPMWAFPQGTPRFGTRSCERHMLQPELSTMNQLINFKSEELKGYTLDFRVGLNTDVKQWVNVLLSNFLLGIEDSQDLFPKLIAKVRQTYSGNNRPNQKILRGNQTCQIKHTGVQFQIYKASLIEAKFGICIAVKICLHDERQKKTWGAKTLQWFRYILRP